MGVGNEQNVFWLAAPEYDYRLLRIITKSASDNALWLDIIITIMATGKAFVLLKDELV